MSLEESNVQPLMMLCTGETCDAGSQAAVTLRVFEHETVHAG
jgi:hypothetical protein